MVELVPGVFAGPRLRQSNCYLVHDKTLTVLVDAGMPGDHPEISRWLSDSGWRLDAVVLTHGDVDHRGQVAQLASAAGAEVWAGREERSFLEGSLRPRRLVRRVMARLMRPVAVDRWLGPEDEVAGFAVWHTPGHTAGHLSLVRLADRVVIAGDALVVGRQGPIMPRSWLNEDQEQATSSAAHLRAIGPSWLLTGHGPPWHQVGAL
ncbi:MAG: MBL fold metallo-hydrolase [Sulfobacillus sp.]